MWLIVIMCCKDCKVDQLFHHMRFLFQYQLCIAQHSLHALCVYCGVHSLPTAQKGKNRPQHSPLYVYEMLRQYKLTEKLTIECSLLLTQLSNEAVTCKQKLQSRRTSVSRGVGILAGRCQALL